MPCCEPNAALARRRFLNSEMRRRKTLSKIAKQAATNLKNFDEETIKRLLKNKEKSVGEIVLVDGRPAVIKKRVVGRNGEMLGRFEVGNMMIIRV